LARTCHIFLIREFSLLPFIDLSILQPVVITYESIAKNIKMKIDDAERIFIGTFAGAKP
jgi:hypothetical protein